MSQPIRGQGGRIDFFNSPKNTNLVEDVENLPSVKFRWIPFSSFIGEVENVSANQRTGRLSCFLISPPNASLLEDVEILLPVKFCWILFSGFRGKVENVSAKRPFCSSDPPEKHKLGRSCFLSSFVEFITAVLEEKSKMSQPIRGQGGHFVFSQLAWKTQMW